MTLCFSSGSFVVFSERGRCELKEFTNPFPEVVKNLYFHQSLVMETFLVADNFDSDGLTSAMITAAQDLAEGTLPKCVCDLISER